MIELLKKIAGPVLWLVLFTSCRNDRAPELSAPEKTCLTETAISDLHVQTVAAVQMVKRLRLNGFVAYDPNSVIHYVSMVSGTIFKTYVSLGDKVEKGQLLAEIQSAGLNSMESEIRQLQNKLEVAKRELQATKSFNRDGLATERELISAESERHNIETEIKNLEANLRLFSSPSANGIYQVRAPQSGYIVENRMVPGLGFSAEGEPLFVISNLDKVWIILDVYASDINHIKEGMPLRIKSGAYPGKVFAGKINKVSSVIDPAKNVLQAWAVLKNASMLLKPGLQVEAIVEVADGSNEVPALPSSAVIFHNNKYYTIVLDSCNVEARQVEVLYQNEDSVFIGEGLNAGEKVATNGALLNLEYSLSIAAETQQKTGDKQ